MVAICDLNQNNVICFGVKLNVRKQNMKRVGSGGEIKMEKVELKERRFNQALLLPFIFLRYSFSNFLRRV